jgi:hypothetical protein
MNRTEPTRSTPRTSPPAPMTAHLSRDETATGGAMPSGSPVRIRKPSAADRWAG